GVARSCHPACTDRRRITPRRKSSGRVPKGSSSPSPTRSRPTTRCALHSSPPHRFGGFGRTPRDPTRLDLRPHAVTTSHAPFGTKGRTAGEDSKVGLVERRAGEPLPNR